MRRLIYFGVFALLLMAVTAAAQDRQLSKHPGYIDLDDIRIPDDAEEVTEIDLGQGLLRLMTLFTDDEEAKEVGDELSRLFSIRVKSFTLDDDAELVHMRSLMEKKEKELDKNDWERLVRTKSKNELSIISIKVVKEKTVGLFIMSLDADGSVSFVNIVGGVNLTTLTEMGIGLSDSTLKALEDNWKDVP